MLNAPATGEAMAELITEGDATTVNLAAFNPARLTAKARTKYGLNQPDTN